MLWLRVKVDKLTCRRNTSWTKAYVLLTCLYSWLAMLTYMYMSIDAMVEGKGQQTYMWTQHELDEGLRSADMYVLMACNAMVEHNLEKVDKLTCRRTQAFM